MIADTPDVSWIALKVMLNHTTKGDVTTGYVQISTEQLRAAVQRVADKLSWSCNIQAVRGANVAKIRFGRLYLTETTRANWTLRILRRSAPPFLLAINPSVPFRTLMRSNCRFFSCSQHHLSQLGPYPPRNRDGPGANADVRAADCRISATIPGVIRRPSAQSSRPAKAEPPSPTSVSKNV